MCARNHKNSAAPSAPGGLVVSVEPDSPADLAGIRPDDRIITLDGYPLRDVIDYQFHFEPVRQMIRLQRDDKLIDLEIDNHNHPHPGIYFQNTLFDGVKQCRCNCAFCFVEQVPAGLREALDLKDDDYRLSFLYGNFVTLNNLDREDIDRIIEQRLGPLFVSVHATDVAVRAGLMGCSRRFASAGLDNLRLLGREGIETHIQIVLCPGINDGVVLEKTVDVLARGYTGLSSIGIVPVAVDERLVESSAGSRMPLRPLADNECRQIVQDIARWQERFRRERAYGFIYAADEFYLRADEPLPEMESYDGAPQYENGIGIVATFKQQADEMLRQQLLELPVGARAFLLTGMLAQKPVAATLKRLEQARPGWMEGRTVTTLTVENHLFGPHVTVTGLLSGADVLAAAQSAGAAHEDILLLPSAVLDSSGERFLDDLTLEEMEERLDCAVLVV
jgi:putative radical SAM enzyme (TIGR03279 family)